MIRVKVNKSQIESAKNAATTARNKLRDDVVVMRQIAVYFDQWVQRNFKTEGGNVGGWAAFKYGGRIRNKKGAKAQSIESRRYVDASAKLLQDTGLLRLSVLPFVDKGVAGIGSTLPYSKSHDEGIPGKLPQRRILMEQREVSVDVRKILDDWVMITLRGAGA